MQDKVSNCCGVNILNENNGEGICSMCKEHCIADKECNNSWVDSRIEVGRDLENILDNLIGSPLEQIDQLINEAHKLKEKYVRQN